MMTTKGVALVTGAGQGIGRAIALRLASDGFDVAVNDVVASEKLNTLVHEITEKGRKSVAIVADVSVEEQVQNMVNRVVKELGALNVMVANAGVATFGPIVETSVEEWDRVFSVNARGTFLCYKYAARQMIQQGRGGRIIGAASVTAKRGYENLSAYAGTKFAVRGLTQSAAIELGKHGITVNAYSPGAIDTDMLRFLDAAITRTSGMKPGEYYEALDKKTVVGHKGTPADVAGLVSYLVSEEARFITGQSISCNGGTYFD